MVNKVFLATLLAGGVFLASGVIELAFCLIVRGERNAAPTSGTEATRDLIFDMFPINAGIVNAGAIILTFVLMLPGLITSSRGWLKASGVLVVMCGLFTMGLGVFLWAISLRFKENFETTYVAQTSTVQGLIQTSFGCCGYLNSTTPPFVTDSTCPSPAAAALLEGCDGFISVFANTVLDDTFTALFGMVGVDAVFILAIACLLKDRKERERYRHIDEKTGMNRI